MSVAWLCPNCPAAQQRVFILCWPLAQDTHSDSGPLVQSTKQCRAAVLLQRASVGQSPGGGVFSDKCVPNLAPHSIASLSFPPCECQCGWAVALWIPCLQIPCTAFICIACIAFNHNRNPYVFQPLFSYWMKLLLSWSMKHKLLYWHWQVFKLLIWSRLCSLNRQNDVTFYTSCCVPAWHVFPVRDSNICFCHKHRVSGCQ